MVLFASQSAFHALLSTLAVTALFAASALLTADISSGIIAAFSFGFAPNVWTYAISTEVFPLNNFFMCTLVLLVVVFARDVASMRNSRAVLFLSAFWCGLSLTNQHTSIFFVAPVVLWVATVQPGIFRPLVFLAICFCFFLGLLPYVYLPISAKFFVTSNSWGAPHSWDGFLTHVLRREYGTFSLASKEAEYRGSDFARAWLYCLKDIHDQIWFLWILVLPALLNWNLCTKLWGRMWQFAYNMSRRGRRKCEAPMTASTISSIRSSALQIALPPVRVLVISWIAYNCVFNYLCNLPIDKPLFYGVQQRFWLQPLILVCLFVAVGFAVVARDWLRLPSFLRLSIAVGIVAVQIGVHFAAQDESQNYYIRDFGCAILAPLPNNSILLTQGDLMINSARFCQVTEAYRRDVTILDQELLTYEWYNDIVKTQFPSLVFPGAFYHPMKPRGYDMKTFLTKNRNPWSRRVFLAYGYKEGDFSTEEKYTHRTFGLSLEAVEHRELSYLRVVNSKTSKLDKSVQQRYIDELANALPDISAVRLPPRGRYLSTSWEEVVLNDFQQALLRTSWQLLVMGELDDMPVVIAKGSEDEAAKENMYYRALRASLRLSNASVTMFAREKTPTFAWRNLGVIYQMLLKFEPKNLAYIAAAGTNMAIYLKEVDHRGETISKEDRGTIKEVIRSYENLLKIKDTL